MLIRILHAIGTQPSLSHGVRLDAAVIPAEAMLGGWALSPVKRGAAIEGH